MRKCWNLILILHRSHSHLSQFFWNPKMRRLLPGNEEETAYFRKESLLNCGHLKPHQSTRCRIPGHAGLTFPLQKSTAICFLLFHWWIRVFLKILNILNICYIYHPSLSTLFTKPIATSWNTALWTLFWPSNTSKCRRFKLKRQFSARNVSMCELPKARRRQFWHCGSNTVTTPAQNQNFRTVREQINASTL